MPASSDIPDLSTGVPLLPADPNLADASGRVPLTVRKGIAIFGIGGVGFMSANLVPLMMIALSNELGVSTTEAGTVMTASMLLTALTSLFLARMAAGSKRRLIARIGLLVAGVGFGVAAIVPFAPIAIAGVVLGGLGAGGGVAAGGAALAALRNPNRVSGISGVSNRVLVTVFLTVIPLFGIIMMSAFGFLALLSLAMLVVVQWLPSAQVTTPVVSATPQAGLASDPRSRPRLTIAGFALLACFALWAISEDSLWAMAGAMGADQTGFSEQDLGLVLSACTVGGLVVAVILSVIGSKGGRAVPLGIMLVLGGALKIWAAFVTDPALYAGILIAWNTIYAVAFMYIVATAAALDASGRWSGPLFGTYLIGSSFAPIVGASIAESFGYQSFGIILACMTFALVVPFVVIARLSSRVEKGNAVAAERAGAELINTAVV